MAILFTKNYLRKYINLTMQKKWKYKKPLGYKRLLNFVGNKGSLFIFSHITSPFFYWIFLCALIYQLLNLMPKL